MGIALPNDAVEEKWGSVKKYLSGTHNFSIETEDGVFNLDFEIKKGSLMANSQVISAFIGCIADDQGNIDEAALNVADQSKLPALIIDGGYKTIADFMFTENYMAEGASSNTDYAMMNIYKAIAEKIRNEYGREDVNTDDIIKHLESDGIIICEKGDNTEAVELKPLFDAAKEEICREYVDHLNKKYNKLLDVKQIIITGGTGAQFYDYIKDYVDKHKTHLKGHVILTDYEFMGRKISPEYGIVVGMYKSLLAAIRGVSTAE